MSILYIVVLGFFAGLLIFSRSSRIDFVRPALSWMDWFVLIGAIRLGEYLDTNWSATDALQRFAIVAAIVAGATCAVLGYALGSAALTFRFWRVERVESGR